ncbi:RNA methyltransferase [Hydrogenophaga sp.]|uniref:TrmH family RNA methyltransferase n=1 Tax=Hydrogenophaga sp. TaxID=1904254 RepID=UPI00271D49E9|nr:RNA methyltransferase [Hydrogenophaga sp.]MDO8905855.1 RNA methyltransferase [Hydrogenophaga sp.]
MNAPSTITSRENPLLKRLRVLARDNAAYRKQGQIWLEGDHLCRALLARNQKPELALFTEKGWAEAPPVLRQAAAKNHVLPEALMKSISGLESPAEVGFVWNMPAAPVLWPGQATVVLDRLQDAGNVGSILRSAAAFGFAQVLAVKGTAALWSPKVVRAAMGAHFGLHLVEGLSVEELPALQVPMVVTSSHQGTLLQQARLPSPCAWVMGHEGQGIGEALQEMASLSVRIPQPGGEESLNAAAAAAICLYASAVSSVGVPG